jgi:hypothetical protein
LRKISDYEDRFRSPHLLLTQLINLLKTGLPVPICVACASVFRYWFHDVGPPLAGIPVFESDWKDLKKAGEIHFQVLAGIQYRASY